MRHHPGFKSLAQARDSAAYPPKTDNTYALSSQQPSLCSRPFPLVELAIRLAYQPQRRQYETHGKFSDRLGRCFRGVQDSNAMTLCGSKIHAVQTAAAARDYFQAPG